MSYEAPRIRRVRSTLEQAFGTTCSAGDGVSSGDICWPTGGAADPGVCTDGSRAYQGQCNQGDRAWGGPCAQGNNTGNCSTGQTAFFTCGTGQGDSPWWSQQQGAAPS